MPNVEIIAATSGPMGGVKNDIAISAGDFPSWKAFGISYDQLIVISEVENEQADLER